MGQEGSPPGGTRSSFGGRPLRFPVFFVTNPEITSKEPPLRCIFEIVGKTKDKWAATDLHRQVLDLGDRWRYKCRHLPALLTIVEAVESALLRLVSLLISAQRASYPSRYDHIRRA